MSAISTEAKVGLFILAGFIILGYMSMQVGKRGFGTKKGYKYDVIFDNAAGLNKEASVQIAGVEVGHVESIKLQDGKALATLRISQEVRLEKGVKAAIKTHGVLGDKYVELTPGDSAQGYIEPGGQIARSERTADIDMLLNQFTLIAEDIKELTGSMSKVLTGPRGEQSLSDIVENTRQLTYNFNQLVKNNEAILRSALENTSNLTGNLNNVVTDNRDRITQTLDGFRDAGQEMQKAFASLNDISAGIKRGDGTLGQLLTDRTTADQLNKTLASLQEVSDKINQGRGTIGKLINDEETVNNLNESLTGINRYVSKAEQFRTFLGYRGEYLFQNNNMKSYVDLRIQPTVDKFYVLGLTSDPRGKIVTRDSTTAGVTTRTEEVDKNGLLFNAQIGKRFQNVALRGGLLESTGGFGIDFMSLDDNLKLSFEAFDFSVDRRAHLKAWADYRFFKHLYFMAGWDDFVSNRGNSSPFAGLSIRFEDDDLKYLLSTTPIPK